jgi:hypothetical protein
LYVFVGWGSGTSIVTQGVLLHGVLRRDSDVVLPCAYIIDAASVLMQISNFKHMLLWRSNGVLFFLSLDWCWCALRILLLGWVTVSGTGASGKRELPWLGLLDSLYERCLLVGHE